VFLVEFAAFERSKRFEDDDNDNDNDWNRCVLVVILFQLNFIRSVSTSISLGMGRCLILQSGFINTSGGDIYSNNVHSLGRSLLAIKTTPHNYDYF